VAGAGGIDSINTYLQQRIQEPLDLSGRDSLAARGVREARVWHRDQLNGLLAKYEGVRLAFKGLITVGDLLARLGALGGLLDPQAFQPVLVNHAITTFGSERWVNFSEAGGGSRESVENVVVDLKASGTRDGKLTVLQEVIERGDQVLTRSLAPPARHLVLTGQPGSGKSTITLFLNQLFRAAFVSDESRTATADAVYEGTAKALVRLGIRGPSNRRWPIRVDLAEYADALGPSGDKSLLRWISERITARAELDIMPVTLKRWFQYWPCLVILDGLDEVTAPEVRPRVLDEIQSFVEQMDASDADLLVLMTTRPTGYNERFMPQLFTQVDLTYLDERAASDYGRLVTTRRLADDLDRRDQLIARFEREAKVPATLRLMKTPLQVLIMTFILERLGTLPSDRYQLFWTYFETMYQREQAKTTSLRVLLSTHHEAIVNLHEAVGLALQQRSETSGDARAVLPKSDLRAMAAERLIEVGHEPGLRTERIADQIVQAATERLVLLVPAEDDCISFEIRSLQELMAARALSDATEEELRARMLLAAPSPHWRNTWVFLAGRLFYEGPHRRRDGVLEVIEKIDHDGTWPGWLCPVAAELAASLLDDGMAAAFPKWQTRLVNIALGVMNGSAPQDIRAVARGLSAVANPDYLTHIRDAIRTNLGGNPLQQHIASLLEDAGTFGQAIHPAWKPPTQAEVNTVVTGRPLADLITPALVELEVTGPSRTVLDAMLVEIGGFNLTDDLDSTHASLFSVLPAQLPDTLAVFEDRDAAAALELALASLGPEHWPATAALAQMVSPSLLRGAVGQKLVS
jgi:hypothetical protein